MIAEFDMISSQKNATEHADPSHGSLVFASTGIFCLIAYLIWGTGLSTDDFVHLRDGLQWKFSEHWWPKEYASVPVLHYTQGLAFFIAGDRPWMYDLIKIAYASTAVYFSSQFFSLFCSAKRALIFGFLFVFYPPHDAADYSLTMFYLVESFSFYLFAYALGSRGSLRWAVLFSFLGSFSSYGSPPIAIGLALFAYTQSQRKLMWALWVPNLVYVIYYLVSSSIFKVGTQRLIGDMNFVTLAREYFLGCVTFFDATVGPSVWMKFYYSMVNQNALSLVIAAMAASALIYLIRSEPQRSATKALIVSAAVIVLLSFGMFSLTGLYPQIAFNLGDRIMVYGSFLILCTVASCQLPKAAEWGFIVIVILGITGISTHWKEWSRDLDQLALNIRNNQALRDLSPNDRVFVSRHQYSRLGPFAHIDFFTASYVVRAFFDLQYGGRTPFLLDSFNRRLTYESNALRDRKFGDVIPVGDAIWLYDSRRNVLDRVPAAQIQQKIDALPDENRHWTQMVEIEWIKSLIARFVPRLRYAY